MVKLLLIDDSPFTLRRHVELVQALGCEAIAAKSGDEAIALFAQRLPELVLCDIMMPEMDGYEVLEALQGIQANLQFYFVSGEMTEEIQRKARSLGAKGVIEKPLQLEVLKKICQNLCSREKSNL